MTRPASSEHGNKNSLATNSAPARLEPFSFRLPKAGSVDPYFGGTRTFWNERVLPRQANNFKPPVRSFVEKQSGATRGIRFIVSSSARKYFEALATKAEEQETAEALK